jgi:hypothetical protein
VEGRRGEDEKEEVGDEAHGGWVVGVVVWLLNAGISGIFRKGGRKERRGAVVVVACLRRRLWWFGAGVYRFWWEGRWIGWL